MHIETVKYKVINVGKTEQNGDAISNASPSVVNDAILRNDARLLEIDVTDRICYCLGNHEKSGISFRELFTDIKAMVVLNKTIPRDTAFQKNLKSTFLKNNKVILEFGNEKSF